MIPKKIGETGWTVQDWDQHWPPVFARESDPLRQDVSIEVRDGEAWVEVDVGYAPGTTFTCIPLEVLAEVLRRNGYTVAEPHDPDRCATCEAQQ